MTDINDILNGKPQKITKVSSFKKNPRANDIAPSDEKKEIDKGGRPRKDVMYARERKEIFNNILKILSVSKDGDIFYINDLDDDVEKQNQILGLEGDIKKCFSASNWKCFLENGVLNKHESIVKHVLKHMNVKLTAVSLSDIKKRKVIRHGYIINF